jgi:hypothetical protein
LRVFELADELVIEAYAWTRQLPGDERLVRALQKL